MEIFDDHVLVSINPKIHQIDTIYAAAYVLIDKAYIVLDGDPKTEIIAEIRPKQKQNPEELGNEFNEQLINYSVYKVQSEKNSDIRNILLQRSLLTNDFIGEDNDKIEDPDEIAVPWEEKHKKPKK